MDTPTSPNPKPHKERGDQGNDQEVNCKKAHDPKPYATSSIAPPSPPSSTSSPSHEFSFTISLHPPPTPTSIKYSKTTPSFAIDLAPADDIFLHGHLLPLHLLSHNPSVAPRPSDTSIETLCLTPLQHFDIKEDTQNPNADHQPLPNPNETKEARSKPKSLSALLFGKWLKGGGDAGEKEEERKKRRKGFDLARTLKKYVSAVEPFLMPFKSEREKRDLRRRPYSFSVGSNVVRERERWGKWRGEFSAPASMRTSPTNSGLLVATPGAFAPSDESSMEELQSAIQAAIAHCKSSIEMKEDNKLKNISC